MSKKKLTTIICLCLAAIIAVFGCLYLFTDIFKPSIQSALGYEGKTILKMKITKYEQSFEITDTAAIAEILSVLDDRKAVSEEEIKNVYGAGPSPIITLYDANGQIAQFDMFGIIVRRYDEDVTVMDNRTDYKRTAITVNKAIDSAKRDELIKKYIPEFPDTVVTENKKTENTLIGGNEDGPGQNLTDTSSKQDASSEQTSSSEESVSSESSSSSIAQNGQTQGGYAD